MNASTLRPGIYRVKITHDKGEVRFNLSVIEGCGLVAVYGYQDGQKPPRRGKHMLLTGGVRHWIDEMQPA